MGADTMGREWSYRNQFGENVTFPRRPMKFQIILSKIMSTRKIAELADHSVSKGSRRGFQLTEKLPREKQSPIERTQRQKETLLDQSQGIIPLRKESQEGETSGSAVPFQQGSLRPRLSFWSRLRILGIKICPYQLQHKSVSSAGS